jgi:hypothetical protein
LPEADVTNVLASRVKDGRLETKVGATSLGTESKPGEVGELTVIYKINGKIDTKTIRGGGTVLILDAAKL